MSLQMFKIGTDKLERLHAEAADRRHAGSANRTPWADLVRWLGFVFA